MKSKLILLVLLSAVSFSVVASEWTSRAEKELKKLLEGPSRRTIAEAICTELHPTGDDAELTEYKIRVVGAQLSVRLEVTWKGGLTHHKYQTIVVWEFDKDRHIKASVTDDSATVQAAPKNIKKLDEYFRTECYATLRNNMKE